MSLLDNASLVLTPNAYKEGKLYSVIPSNGNGDFTATRATTATRVNAAGLVDLVPYNLVQYSQLFTNAIWTNFNSVTTGGQTGYDGATNAALITKSGANGYLRQTSLPSANTHTASIYAKADSVNFIALAADFGTRIGYFDLSNGTTGTATNLISSSISSVGNGWYRCTITASTLSDVRIFPATTNGSTAATTGSVFIQYAQAVEGTSARDYLRTETRLNIPRVDYSLGGCPNILLEPQRTNLALQSSSFDSASWTKSATTATANTTTSPSGIIDADTLTGDGTLAIHEARQTGFATLTSGVTYTTSIYAKKNTNNFIQLVGTGFSYPSTTFANFDLNSGVVGTVGSGTTASIQSVGNGWYRCSITATATSTGNTNTYIVTLVTSATSPRVETNSLSTSVFLWGAQLEAGAYSTSFIPTTTASVTRNADSITRNNIFTNGLITAAGGTWFVEFRNNVPLIRDASGGELYIGEDANSAVAPSKQSISFRNGGGTARRLQVNYWNGAAVSIIFQTTTDTCKIAIKFTATSFDVFENGVKVVTAQPISWTLANAQNLNGLVGVSRYINEMALFPTPLTDAQCLALTA